jgi:hypothetical protein
MEVERVELFERYLGISKQDIVEYNTEISTLTKFIVETGNIKTTTPLGVGKV